jgi:hypothetical protein
MIDLLTAQGYFLTDLAAKIAMPELTPPGNIRASPECDRVRWAIRNRKQLVWSRARNLVRTPLIDNVRRLQFDISVIAPPSRPAADRHR